MAAVQPNIQAELQDAKVSTDTVSSIKSVVADADSG